ncbi:hypothetical protein M514_01729 [Trichuris suis]|uniref:GPR1/FUN34/YaaH family protein n=1 Tax=Trichuris suis TaxID=68888 RepID=A0A085NT13_9BILA|nr:hypothetical protein M513_01729 [Trichuris suis]KFD72609.1 hypothetical protein M514_01729 [Trichuris suis]KHJ46487.1 hypothetical protein D918_03540 [Trichuris suis]
MDDLKEVEKLKQLLADVQSIRAEQDKTVEKLQAELQLNKQKMKKEGAPPAIVGFAGLGIGIIALQLEFFHVHSPLVAAILLFFFGGLLQLVAGFQEQAEGNSYAFCLFTVFGALSCVLAVTIFANVFGVYKPIHSDFHPVDILFTIFNAIWLVPNWTRDLASFTICLFFFLAFVMADFAFWVPSNAVQFLTARSIFFIFGGFLSWYFMVHFVYKYLYGYDVLPLGPAPVTIAKKWWARFKSYTL